MAKQTSLIKFTGKLGNMIGYCRNGEHFIRSMPETVRQTTATRRAARRFGMASKKGALIRSAFSNQLDVQCDGGHINRLNKTLIQAGSNNSAITGFRFNQHTGTDKFFTIAPKLSPDGILHIPAQALPEFKGITALEVKVIAARIDFAEHEVVSTEAAMIILDLRTPFAGAALSMDIPGAGMLVVTLQVRGMRNGWGSCDKRYTAADIIAVREPQTPHILHKPSYPHQRLLQRRMSLASPARTHHAPLTQRE